MTDLLPPPVRVALAAVGFGLAWWAFGRTGAATRRPWVVWAVGFGAAWLALAGEGVAFLLSDRGRGWLPAVAVGVVGSWFAVRGRRGTADGRRWAAGAVALLVASPFLSRANAVVEATFGPAALLRGVLGGSFSQSRDLVADGLGAVTVLAGTVCVAVAAWPRAVPNPAPDAAPNPAPNSNGGAAG